MRRWFPNKTVLIGFAALTLGQVLYFFHFRALFVLALVYFFATAITYPRILRSLLSRLVASFVLCMSLLQLVAAIQFFVFPSSGFVTISLITFVLSGVVAVVSGRSRPAELPPLMARQDFSAVIMTLFFVVPLLLLFFRSFDATRILSFSGIQSPDAVSHYSAISEMTYAQHLDYRVNSYYPRGFHLASAFMLDSVHLDQQKMSWRGNEQLSAGLYVAWGTLLGYVLYIFSYQLLQGVAPRPKRYVGPLLALALGPIVALFYLAPFVFLGFINYYYVCAAVLCGLLFLMDYDWRKIFDWPLVLYFAMVFGVSMSWGPLLVPALLSIPVLYIVKERGINELLAMARSKRFWAFVAIYAIELIPIYVHVKYAHLTGSQGVNATGIITDFHYGIDLIGLGILVYLLGRDRISKTGALLVNSLLAFFTLVGLLVFYQLFTVGELRYYAIKTSYLLELLILASAAVLLIRLVWGRLHTLQVWIGVPVAFFLGVLLVSGMTSNPLVLAQKTFRHYSHFPYPKDYGTDVASYAKLGEQNKLTRDNNEVLHYDSGARKIYGDGLVQAAAVSFASGGEGPPRQLPTDNCHWMIFFVLTAGKGTAHEQAQLRDALRQCVEIAQSNRIPYYVVTDQKSAQYLRPILGSYVRFVY